MDARRQSGASWAPIGPEVELRTARLLCAMAVAVYPLFWIADGLSGLPFQDPLWLRLGVTGLVASVWVGLHASPWAQRHVRGLLLGLVYVVTTHAYVLLAINDLHQTQAIGVVVVLTGFVAVASYTISGTRQLVAYMAYTVAACVASAWIVEAPKTHPFYLVLSIASVVALASVAVHTQLDTLRRLVTSEALLRRDVERRMKVEEALRASERRAKGLLLAVPDVMMRLARDGTVLEVLNAQQTELGAFCERQRGKPLDAVLRVTEDDDAVTSAIEAVLDEGLGATALTAELEDMRDRHVEIRVAPAGENEALALVRDVTEERAMAARLRMTDRLASLGTLASGVAHEINNPLTYVLGNIEHTLDVLGDDASLDRAELREVLGEAREGAQRIQQIVADLHDHGRGDGDAIGAVDANEVVRAALRMMDNQLRHRAVLQVELGQLPKVRANSSRLAQMLVNLLTNAIQALPERSSSENLVSVSTRTSETGESVIVEVGDNGPGIPPELRVRVFDPFFTTRANVGSTGLGLYLCHRFVTSFGGEMEVRDRPGGGALIRVTLAPSGITDTSKSKAVSLGELGDVLVVDDNRLVGRAIARMLGAQDVVVAGSVDEALAITAKRKFHVILCDLMMPAKDGSVLFRALSANQPGQAKRVVFMTGGVFTEHLRTFIESVDNPCLQKPLQRAELVAAIRDL